MTRAGTWVDPSIDKPEDWREIELAARMVGLAYLLAIVFSVFAEFYVLGRVVTRDAAETAHRIAGLTPLVHLGVGSDMLSCIVDGLLIAGLYRILAGTSRLWATLALFWGIVETTVLLLAISSDLVALKLLGPTPYLQAVPAHDLAIWAQLSFSVHGLLYTVALTLAGLRSTLFCWLWWRSRLIPRWLAGFGVLASLWLFACVFGGILFPDLAKIASIAAYGTPIFLFELAAGLWLLIRGVRPGAAGLARFNETAADLS